jgi:hypothetical protein
MLALQPDERFAVYSGYQLEPSNEPTLPETPDFTPESGEWWRATQKVGLRVGSRTGPGYRQATGNARHW